MVGSELLLQFQLYFPVLISIKGWHRPRRWWECATLVFRLTDFHLRAKKFTFGLTRALSSHMFAASHTWSVSNFKCHSPTRATFMHHTKKAEYKCMPHFWGFVKENALKFVVLTQQSENKCSRSMSCRKMFSRESGIDCPAWSAHDINCLSSVICSDRLIHHVLRDGRTYLNEWVDDSYIRTGVEHFVEVGLPVDKFQLVELLIILEEN